MFFLFVLSPIFIGVYIYQKYVAYTNYIKSLTFSDNVEKYNNLNNNDWLILSVEQYNENYEFIQEIIIDKECSISKKFNLDINNLNNYNINLDTKYNIINYTYKDEFYKLLVHQNEENNIIKFPIVNDIKKYIYINKIKKIILFNKYNVTDITNISLKYIGPNYNFYSETNFKQNINIILKIEEIINKEIEKSIDKKEKEEDNFYINIYDNFDNKIKLTEYFDWKPTLI